jgi:DNA helicase-2/ATP-dependent DNA helicase PcrA
VNRDDLSCRQREVVEATGQLVVVTGGAGSGKTTAALWAARDHLARVDASPAERVLFATFSRTAVGLIAQRSRALLAEFGERIEVHTFHSLSYRLLSDFGRYTGYGRETPSIESEARAKLLGRDGTRLSYDDLIPIALQLLENDRISELAGQRWTLVICDEFQDTSTDQWDLLKKVSANGRLLVFADPHQMIHSWRPTVTSRRLEEAREEADLVIELEEASHRDPSGVIPAMAARVRERDFEDDALHTAIEAERLVVVACTGDDVPSVVRNEIREARQRGCRSIGVFETTNRGVAELGAELTALGQNHTLIGIPEAQGEGLLAQALLLGVGLGAVDFSDALLQLGVFLTASVRSNEPPPLAIQMRDGLIASGNLRARFEELEASLQNAGDTGQLLEIVGRSWEELGITAGVPVWRRAARSFEALVRRLLIVPLEPRALAEEALSATTALYTEALITGDSPEIGSVQLMNFHQTKGREADAVILVYREGGFVAGWTEREPFEEKSRLLYVGLTRARERVTVLLPPEPHELVAPLAPFARDV